MVELGMAVAWGKPTFLFRDDFRRCTDSEIYPLNLMLFTGLPEAGWEAFWYGAVEEIADPDRAHADVASACSRALRSRKAGSGRASKSRPGGTLSS